MGRHAGWITAAVGLAEDAGDADPATCCCSPRSRSTRRSSSPRVDAKVEALRLLLRRRVRGPARTPTGKLLAEAGHEGRVRPRAAGRRGPADREARARTSSSYKYHWAVADYLQRAARHIASKTDLEHSPTRSARPRSSSRVEGKNAVMPAIVRTSDKPTAGRSRVAPLARRRQRREDDAARLHHARTASASPPRRAPISRPLMRARTPAVQGRAAAVRAAEERRRCRRSSRPRSRSDTASHGHADDRSTTTSRPSRLGRYLGHERFVALVARARRDDRREADGPRQGVPGLGRTAARRSARRSDRRIGSSSSSAGASYLGMPLNLHRRSSPGVGRTWRRAGCSRRSSRAARPALEMTGARRRARWAEERDIADPATLRDVAHAHRTRCGRARRARATPEIAGELRGGDAGGDRPQRLRRAQVRLRRRAVLGTGPARLPGPRTGKIACFGGRAGPPEGAARRHGRRSRRSPRPRHRTPAECAAALSPSTSFRENHHVHSAHLRARLRGRGHRLRRRVDQMDPGQARRQRPHARDRRGDPGRRARPTSTASTRPSASSASSCSSSSACSLGWAHRRRLRDRRRSCRASPATSA